MSKWGSALCWVSKGTVVIIAAIIEGPATFCKLPKFRNLLCQFERTLALSAAGVPVGLPLYMTLRFDQKGMRGQPPQPTL